MYITPSSKLLAYLFVLLLACPGVIVGQNKTVRLGVLPVFDSTGESHGETLAQHLTSMIFSDLQQGPVEPVLLNPGGLYLPSESDWILDYGRTAGVDGVVVTTLKPTERRKSGPWTVRVESELVDLTKRDRVPLGSASVNANRRDLTVQVGYAGPFFYAPSRRFEKQPLGRISRELAKVVSEQVTLQAPTRLTQGSFVRPTLGKGTCDVQFRVRYVQTKQSSKAYMIILNDREESLSMHDGVAKATLPSGAVLVQVQVNDPPYKLPVQQLYQANSYLDCANPERELALEIGPAGEALLRWH